MSYRVIKHFLDLQDNNHAYNEGDIFPRKDFSVLPSRIRELSTSANKQGVPLIKEVLDAPAEEKKPKVKKADAE